ncbi:MAG TPA: serine hydrolase domain-containing protein [Gemmatales bacterium]|nr:serine hydrolase domain-containing protein [Gemmatales bacterium]HMP58737.1 serine hydrolase domain-containing protein [Gemmatales bacterium]
MNLKEEASGRRWGLRQRLLAATLAFMFLALVARGDDLPRGDAKAQSFSPEKLERIPALLKEAVEKKQIAGGVALVARRGKVIHVSTAGMQDIGNKVPMGEGAIFRIASMSKPITSVAVMQLVEDGKLRLTDTLSTYVPEFKDMKVAVPAPDGQSFVTVKAEREITIHDLLTHTSGITYRIMSKPHVGKLYEEAGVCDGLVESRESLADNVRKIARLPLVCQPGSAWEYGLNTDVLGQVVEVVSGKSLEEFMRQRIFNPLGMNDTCFNLPKDKHARLASLYTILPDKSLSKVGETVVTTGPFVYSGTVPTRVDNQYFSGGAGLVSTAGDYFRFGQMMLNGGELNGMRVLKAETVAAMTRNQLGSLRIMPGASQMGYGFGVLSAEGKQSQSDPSGVGTFGWGGAYGTIFWVDPENEVVAVLMAQVFPQDFTLSVEFKKAVYAALTAAK